MLPVAEDEKGVQSLLGLVNYVGKFIPNLSEMTIERTDGEEC